MKPKLILADLRRNNPDAITLDGCDEALIGTKGAPAVAVYSRKKLVEVFMGQGMTYDEADEWISFNIEGAFMGLFTPTIRG